jgi:hypothetical protein
VAEPENQDVGESPGNNIGKKLLKYALRNVELFKDLDGEGYAAICVDAHRENVPVQSIQFARWLGYEFYRREGIPAGSTTVQNVISTLDAIATQEGKKYPLFVRVGEEDGKIYLDLADDKRRVVEVSQEGWDVVIDCPVRFLRPKGMRPLPVPERGGSLNELRGLLNTTSNDYKLIAAWIVAALRHQGPYPVLVIHGEQGSAKSTTCRMLRTLIDPNHAALRTPPKSEEDLPIAARNSWVIALDNVSHIADWLSDTMCRVATGGGFGKRQRFTDTDEILFQVQRPQLVNGIEEVATRGDLLDRSIVIDLPAIPPDKRKDEDQFPAAVILSLPLPDSTEKVLAGIIFGVLDEDAKIRLQHFRRKESPAAFVQLQFANRMACQRLLLERFDPDFLLPRGGAHRELYGKRIAIIGCGAVGSYILLHLASAGIGEFRLVDPETLTNANCHRHVLGVRHVGGKKVFALAAEFSANYPHQTFLAMDQKIQYVLDSEPDFILGADLVVIALGDETLALYLDRKLRPKRQVHAWLDPMGLGGHVLSTGESRGCFSCLFKRDPAQLNRLYNAASFAAAGQNVQRSFSGCAGVFTPFSALDADRVGAIAARESIAALLNPTPKSVLVSWFGDRTAFERNGFNLSKRAHLFEFGQERVESDFQSDDCHVCGGPKNEV